MRIDDRRSHPVELRRRVMNNVAKENTQGSTAARLRLSVKFVNEMVKLTK